jgi:hypothetical protein
MTDNEIIDELCALLCRLPGVSIAWKQTPLGLYRIGVRVEDSKSRALLVHLHWNCVIAVEPELFCVARRSELLAV